MGPDSTPAEVLAGTRTIAVVGASPDPDKPSHGVMRYLLEQGYRVIPVRPGEGEILGVPVANSLAGAGGPIHVVNVFRQSEAAPGIAHEAVTAGAGCLWLQPGCVSDEEGEIARLAGLAFVQDLCVREVHGAEGIGAVGPSLLP